MKKQQAIRSDVWENTKAVQPDGRTREDVINQIKELAEAYTPEWKFDPANPDAGTALAILFADMFSETIRRYDRILEKHRLSFYEKMGLKLEPAEPAKGYVEFGLSSDEFGGAAIPKGTAVLGEDVSYETSEAMYVTPARICKAFLTDGRIDYIGSKDWNQPFFPFLPEENNLQEHVFYLCENQALEVEGQADIFLAVKPYGYRKTGQTADWLMDEENFTVSYGTEDGFEAFAGRRMDKGRLRLTRRETQPPIGKKTMFGTEGFWLCCRYTGAWREEPFVAEDIRISSANSAVRPDLIQNEIGEQTGAEIYLFGETPHPFSECCFASKEVFGKPGAGVKMTFRLDYEKRPFDNSYQTPREWKLLMKRDDFTPDPEYDITIEEVVWEYYDGSGFRRLFPGEDYRRIFNGGNTAGQQVTLEFPCPPDAGLLEWQAAPNRYIRVRILKMKNMFRQKGSYIVPVISDVRFSYAYAGNGVYPELLAVRGNMAQTVIPASAICRETFCQELFWGFEEKRRMLYLGFHQPPVKGPIKLFYSVEEESRMELPELSYEYYGANGFKPLSVIDGTKSLQRNGTVTFLGPEDFQELTVCGVRAYWIRVVDEKNGYEAFRGAVGMPKIRGIFLNTVPITAVSRKPAEYFGIEPGEKNKVCRLQNQDIYELEVWVCEQNANGTGAEGWVKWEETEDFCGLGKKDRCYMLDRINGIITFGDGEHGAIPKTGSGPGIRAEYSCGGGAAGNLPVGAVNRLGGSLGYVNRVYNPLPIQGGYDRETGEEALLRGKAAMRHLGRAVTADDYEALACAASRFVRKAKCFPHYNANGDYEPGSITLVLLLKEFETGRMQFESVKNAVWEYLSGRMSGNQAALARLSIIEPRFLRLSCNVEAVTADIGSVFEVTARMKERLSEFINPVTGNYNGNGWEIGVLPNETQIINALKGIPDLLYIRKLRLSIYQMTGQGQIEVLPESGEAQKKLFSVGLCGESNIEVAID